MNLINNCVPFIIVWQWCYYYFCLFNQFNWHVSDLLLLRGRRREKKANKSKKKKWLSSLKGVSEAECVFRDGRNRDSFIGINFKGSQFFSPRRSPVWIYRSGQGKWMSSTPQRERERGGEGGGLPKNWQTVINDLSVGNLTSPVKRWAY